ncbi:MAG: hypothetical protein KGI51_09190 [Rhodospirillales bacterium]|nr:hypothetical protein [Rhodospirillales bacterium]
MSCPLCADGSERAHSGHDRILNLLALIEHPSALPAADALRIAEGLLDWSVLPAPALRCEPVAP